MIKNNLFLLISLLMLTSCNSLVVFTWNVRDVVTIVFIIVFILVLLLMWILMMMNKIFRKKKRNHVQHPNQYQ